ncbi:hypothetical protein FBULB1_5982 [Fusarium bulbicola]|nr:hypothetical protein FBULB1_5982 [Fusarium bulbicola]
MIIALAYAVRKCLDLGKAEHSDPICTDFNDSLPPLGERPFTGPANPTGLQAVSCIFHVASASGHSS